MSQEQSLLNALDAAGIAWAMTKHQAVCTLEESAQLMPRFPERTPRTCSWRTQRSNFVSSALRNTATLVCRVPTFSHSPSFKTRVTKRREASTPITFLWLVLFWDQ